MDSTLLVAIPVAAAAIIVAVTAVVLTRRRAKPAARPLSLSSEARTFVGLGPRSQGSDATAVGHMVARSDATVVDVRPAGTVASPPAAGPGAPPSVAAGDRTLVSAPALPDAPTVVIGGGHADVTAPTIRIPKLHARVTVIKGGSGTYELDAREYQIGRSANADLVLPDPSVSGHHAKLAPHGEAFAVSDLGSTNGTTVDGRAVQGEYVLRGGETIGIGDARLRYERLA